jgi:UDP-glucose 6-dehydrogenase
MIKLKIGICGCGFVGGAAQNYFSRQTSHLTTVTYDKYKNIGEFTDLASTDVLFVCLPTLYDDKTRTYDMREINETIYKLFQMAYKGGIVIKSTVLPDYCWMINSVYPTLSILHNPEFLSAQTAVDDFAEQRNIVIGTTKWSSPAHIATLCQLYSDIFPIAKVTIVRAEEASMVKLACNAFYATKVQYFTEIYLLCQKLQFNFDLVRDLMVGNGWIHPQHTRVPGPDGLVSFGGACLPKDLAALDGFMAKKDVLHGLVTRTKEEQTLLRPKSLHGYVTDGP